MAKTNPSLKQKVLARLFGEAGTENPNRFLGYCKIHKIYFQDRKHTDETIRCPECEKEFFIRIGMKEKNQ